MTDSTKYEAPGRDRLFPRIFTASLVLVALFVIGWISVMSWNRHYEGEARAKALHQARSAAAERALAISAPIPAQVSMRRCSERISLGARHAERAGYSPRAREAFFGVDPSAVDAIADVILTECAESFVLEGGAVDEMLVRAEMLAPYLSDEFQVEDRALSDHLDSYQAP
jgi:hypothetical protein